MVAWWSQLGGADRFFVICATIGGVFFLFRLILQFSGVFGDMDADTDVDADVDVDVDADVGDHVDAATADAGDIGAADFSFQLFTLAPLLSKTMEYSSVSTLTSSRTSPAMASSGRATGVSSSVSVSVVFSGSASPSSAFRPSAEGVLPCSCAGASGGFGGGNSCIQIRTTMKERTIARSALFSII